MTLIVHSPNRMQIQTKEFLWSKQQCISTEFMQAIVVTVAAGLNQHFHDGHATQISFCSETHHASANLRSATAVQVRLQAIAIDLMHTTAGRYQCKCRFLVVSYASADETSHSDAGDNQVQT